MAVEKVVSIFMEISSIPRVSGNEAAMSDWLCGFAMKRRLTHTKDSAGNVIIEVPASPGYERFKPVILQSHMDMVGVKEPGSGHDFSKDPINVIEYEEDGNRWLTAEGTTLGADNGIGMALSLAMIDEEHPLLEIMFTTQEETGLVGANELDPDLIRGRRMINLDFEEVGKFCVGCAGAQVIGLSLQIKRVEPSADQYRITCSGLKGGHTGIDIHKGRANAIKLIARLLESAKCRLVDIRGGQAVNAIPSECSAVVESRPEIEDVVEAVRSEFATVDPSLSVELEKVEVKAKPMDWDSSRKAISLLLGLPDGVLRMSDVSENGVDTSVNLGMVESGDGLKVDMMTRSSKQSRISSVVSQVKAIAGLAGADVEEGESFPPWDADYDSPLLKQATGLYESLFKDKARVVVIHAGLECGIIKDMVEGLDAISLGPDIEDCHTVDERVDLDSVGRMHSYLVRLLQELKD